MFNLFDIVRAAQGGQAVDNMARQFGMSPEQARLAVAALLPAFAMGMQRSAAQPDALAQILQMMGSERYKPFYESPAAAFSPQAQASGQDALGRVFGSPELARLVAEQAGKMSGVAAETVAKVMPVLAATLMGGMAQAASAQGLAPAFQRYAEMMGKASFAPAPPPPPQPPPPPANPWQEMMEGMMRSAAAAQAGMQPGTSRPGPSEPGSSEPGSSRPPGTDAEKAGAPNPWEEMFAAMMGAARPAGEARQPEPEPGPARGPEPGSGPGPAGSQDVFSAYEQMVRSGRELHDSHVTALRALFDGFWGRR